MGHVVEHVQHYAKEVAPLAGGVTGKTASMQDHATETS